MTVAPYGAWRSPISIDDLLSASTAVSSVRVDGDQIYWLQSNPAEGGRLSLWRRAFSGGGAVEVTPAPAYVRTRVHEYGGGEYAVGGGQAVYSDFGDNGLWVAGPEPRPLAPGGSLHYADLRLHPARDLVLAVREDARGEGEPIASIVALTLSGSNDDGGRVLVSGADFYAAPALSPDGRLAWLEWMHPDMPWDATVLKVASFDGERLGPATVVAGGPGESVLHPVWLGEDLLFVSDRSDWWNLYRWDGRTTTAVHPDPAEYCLPLWQLGTTPYAVADSDRLICMHNAGGRQRVGLLRLSTSELDWVTEPGVGLGITGGSLGVGHGFAAAVLHYPDRSAAVMALNLEDQVWRPVQTTSSSSLPAGTVSIAEPVSWSSPLGPVHGFYYPPTNPGQVTPPGSRPPMITLTHGGPTAISLPDFRLLYQFWTSRGFAILDVNYGGSIGFGRAYRERLNGNWGVVDVDDCVSGVAAMVEQGRADPNRIVIKGGSAGGYTTLRALTTSTAFAAGISWYGVGDLEALARDTHKFESRYLDRLVGPYPEARALYRERSPIHAVDRLAAPILLLQGTEDRVVPPDQSAQMAEAARAKGLPVAYLTFPGEGHGFRRSESMRRAVEAEIDFLARILGHRPADVVPTIPIDNLDRPAG